MVRFLLAVLITAIASACASDPVFGKPTPASFASYPVTGKLDSVTVADLEAVTAMIKPAKTYGLDIVGHNEIWVQVTPTYRGGHSSKVLKRVHGKWQMQDERMFIISAIQLLPSGS